MVLSLSVFAQGGTGEKQLSAAPEARATEVAGLPHFILKDVNGASINLQSFKGKKVFFNLWASWCPPCRVEMPSIQKLAQSIDTGKVAFVLLSLDHEFEKAKRYLQREGLSCRSTNWVGRCRRSSSCRAFPPPSFLMKAER